MRLKAILTMFIILLATWVILNNSLSLQVLVSGGILSLAIAIAFCKNCDVFSQIRYSPKAIAYTVIYLFVFLGELIKSNLDMAMRILSPSLPINPGIIRAKTHLNSKMARLILANSITLTPGTFTVDIIENELFIHCVNLGDKDPEEYGQKIIRKFEKYLEVIYG